MATVTLKGNEVKLAGKEKNVGDKAPEVQVVKSDDLSDITVGGAKENAQLIIAVPSLDTPICAMETSKFNQEAAGIEGLEVTVVSMDLPFAAKRFCSTEGIENLTVASDYRNKDFANEYGVLIAEGPLAGVTARAIFVIDRDGNIVYKQLVPEITEEPNYQEALEAAKAAAAK
ncbi:thiol peroxidase [Nitratifractor salsuginis]|uniref:Thiol peroxidase n=1 Tax=Nitratifractor salsuginis (strain DSM 16511 / JCM 12458 / E9I37-1) TaxID=749222 RepID=E6X3A6_NITSE|nr:thiol peroxidase [Nitratifractor salsuginis]ADV47319.1 thiol peroxidase (atypical 2-Cys peroxiredoxin) [Nitratifractor salsuginis DSM 16511]